MADAGSVPSREQLRAERDQVQAEIADYRRWVAWFRARTADADKHYADSFDRLVESQKLVRSDDVGIGQLFR